MYGKEGFANHSEDYIIIALIIMSGLDENNRLPQKALFLQTRTGTYKFNFRELYQSRETHMLEKYYNDFELTDEEKINIIVECLEFLDFIKEDIAKQEEYEKIEIGAMIETKQATYISDKIALVADFVSIVTNDLTESVLDKKRDINDRNFTILNDKIKKYIETIVRKVKKVKDITINICGNHSNKIENLEYLLALNINYITYNPNIVYSFINLLSERQSISKIKILKDRRSDKMKKIEKGSKNYFILLILSTVLCGIIIFPLLDFIICKFITNSQFTYSINNHIIKPTVSAFLFGSIYWQVERNKK